MFVLPVCQATDSGDWPQLAYVFPAPWDAIPFNWMGRSANRGQCVQKARSVNLGLSDRVASQLPLAAYTALQGTRTGVFLFCVVCWPLSYPPK